jgi:hypothetical protein
VSILFLAFWDFNEIFKVFRSVGGSIKHIVAQGRRITGTFAVAGMFGGVVGKRMWVSEEYRGVGSAEKASTRKYFWVLRVRGAAKHGSIGMSGTAMGKPLCEV